MIHQNINTFYKKYIETKDRSTVKLQPLCKIAQQFTIRLTFLEHTQKELHSYEYTEIIPGPKLSNNPFGYMELTTCIEKKKSTIKGYLMLHSILTSDGEWEEKDLFDMPT